MDIYSEEKIVLTLDAGGTNFIFSAMQGGTEIVAPVHQLARFRDLTYCLEIIIEGFTQVYGQLSQKPDAISFAFPGPADYTHGIIGDLQNLPVFRGGVPLGPILEYQFNIPVFIRNDGDLFTYGEAMGGALPTINKALQENGSSKQYHNVTGITLGTGFGAGLVHKGQLITGDNAMAAEVWNTSNRFFPDQFAEELISTRAIIRNYKEFAREKVGKATMPSDIYHIAIGEIPGDRKAAQMAFYTFGVHLGDSLANLITLFDGIVVIGGGLTGARSLYMPGVASSLEKEFTSFTGQKLERTVQKIYNLDEQSDKSSFMKDYGTKVTSDFIPGKTFDYDPVPRTGIITSELGASKAIALGAYAVACHELIKGTAVKSSSFDI